MDPFVDRTCHRVTLIRPILITGAAELDFLPFRQEFKLGRLNRYAELVDELLPQVTRPYQCDGIEVLNLSTSASIAAGRLRVADVGGGIFLALFTLDVEGDYRDLIAVLNAGYESSVRFEQQSVEELLVTQLGCGEICSLGPQRHQLAFWAGPNPDADIVQRLVYRADMPADPSFCSFVRPEELNRRPDGSAYLGAYVSVLCHQQDYVENAALLSALRIVGALARVTAIKNEAWEALNQLRKDRMEVADLATRRARAGRLATRLRDLHIDLAFQVEDSSTLADTIPSLRVEAFHRALWQAVELDEHTKIISGVLERLTSAVAAEQQAIEALESRRDTWRRLSWSIPVAVVSAIAVPATVVLGFFGIGTVEIYPGTSMFDLQAYGRLYVLVCLVLLAAAISGWLIGRHGRRLVARDQEAR